MSVKETTPQVKPMRGKAHGVSVEIDMETRRQMAAAAQCLGLRTPDELTQMVLHAFLDLYREDHWLTFPLMFQQVEPL